MITVAVSPVAAKMIDGAIADVEASLVHGTLADVCPSPSLNLIAFKSRIVHQVVIRVLSSEGWDVSACLAIMYYAFGSPDLTLAG